MKRYRLKKQNRPNLIIKNMTTTRLSHEGRGIGSLNGKTVFIQDALADEIVDYELLNRKKNYEEGRCVQVHQTSNDRVDPFCKHYSRCGGCTLQHMNESAQIVFKQKVLLELLSRTGNCNPDKILLPIIGPVKHYRHKARLSVRYIEKKNTHLIGFREKNNARFVANIDSCQILHKKIDTHLSDLKMLLGKFDQKECIAQIELAVGSFETALIFRNLTNLTVSEIELLHNFSKDFGFKIYLQPKDYTSIVPLNGEKESSLLVYELPSFKLKFLFHPSDFIQVNAEINHKMVQQAMELLNLNAQDKALDLFCGLGNFALPMATLCDSVTGIESSDLMVQRATMNAKHNHLDNVQYIQRDLFNENALFKSELQTATKIVLDPPRSGALEVVKQLKHAKASHVLYVSCNPVSLARDAAVLVNDCGYRLDCVGVMDMFPHTGHVESMALFIKD